MIASYMARDEGFDLHPAGRNFCFKNKFSSEGFLAKVLMDFLAPIFFGCSVLNSSQIK
jgi:hypothetical protein